MNPNLSKKIITLIPAAVESAGIADGVSINHHLATIVDTEEDIHPKTILQTHHLPRVVVKSKAASPKTNLAVATSQNQNLSASIHANVSALLNASVLIQRVKKAVAKRKRRKNLAGSPNQRGADAESQNVRSSVRESPGARKEDPRGSVSASRRYGELSNL